MVEYTGLDWGQYLAPYESKHRDLIYVEINENKNESEWIQKTRTGEGPLSAIDISEDTLQLNLDDLEENPSLVAESVIVLSQATERFKGYTWPISAEELYRQVEENKHSYQQIETDGGIETLTGPSEDMEKLLEPDTGTWVKAPELGVSPDRDTFARGREVDFNEF